MSELESIAFDPEIEKQVMISYMERDHGEYVEAKHLRDRSAGLNADHNEKFDRVARLFDSYLSAYVDLDFISIKADKLA